MARGRGKASPQDKEALRIISEKIRELLKEQGKKQIELSRITGIPASTLTGYVKGTSLPVPENLEKIAAFFQVAVAEIDPRLRNDFVVIDSEIERLYKQLDEGNQENLLHLIKIRNRLISSGLIKRSLTTWLFGFIRIP